MFLMFQLARLDVWPVGALRVRRGYGLAWKIPTPTARELEPVGDPYRPYRTVLTWYCWRAAELLGGAAQSELTQRGFSSPASVAGLVAPSLPPHCTRATWSLAPSASKATRTSLHA
jgi:hypothetical protein